MIWSTDGGNGSRERHPTTNVAMKSVCAYCTVVYFKVCGNL